MTASQGMTVRPGHEYWPRLASTRRGDVIRLGGGLWRVVVVGRDTRSEYRRLDRTGDTVQQHYRLVGVA